MPAFGSDKWPDRCTCLAGVEHALAATGADTFSNGVPWWASIQTSWTFYPGRHAAPSADACTSLLPRGQEMPPTVSPFPQMHSDDDQKRDRESNDPNCSRTACQHESSRCPGSPPHQNSGGYRHRAQALGSSPVDMTRSRGEVFIPNAPSTGFFV